MSSGKTSKSKGGVRKIGRNRAKCAAYALAGRRERNKARRIAKDARRHRVPEQVTAEV